MNEDAAKDYLGKTVLVGVTYVDHQDQLIEQKQWYGTVIEISTSKGIVIKLANSGDYFALPPDVSTLEPAGLGEYRLRSTGETITDPDFLTTWVRKAPAQ